MSSSHPHEMHAFSHPQWQLPPPAPRLGSIPLPNANEEEADTKMHVYMGWPDDKENAKLMRPTYPAQSSKHIYQLADRNTLYPTGNLRHQQALKRKRAEDDHDFGAVPQDSFVSGPGFDEARRRSFRAVLADLVSFTQSLAPSLFPQPIPVWMSALKPQKRGRQTESAVEPTHKLFKCAGCNGEFEHINEHYLEIDASHRECVRGHYYIKRTETDWGRMLVWGSWGLLPAKDGSELILD
ncbi:hypothetical protein MKEN_00727900 [Mycena kentingensis (nom. inval.)]|nr:hypothetical protein MKEN_00727900 [Mycena kentingensis (nom. inval.)]